MIIDAEDRFSTMVPDEQKRMKLFLDICQRDPLSGNRHSGEKIKRYLKKSGYHKIVVHSKCVNAKEKEKEKMTLKDAAVGQTVKVKKLSGAGPVKRRIMDMGITKGVDIYVRKVAPLGDPVEVTVRDYELSLRKADAAMIEVE